MSDSEVGQEFSPEDEAADQLEIELVEEFDPFALIMLVRWLQSHVKKPDKKLHSIEGLAKDYLGVSRDSLNRFLLQQLNRGEDEQAKAQEYAVKLKPVFDQGRPFPPAIRKLYKSIYGDTVSLLPDAGKPVQLVEVLRHRSMSPVEENPVDITPLIGLSALVRISDDDVPAPELGEGIKKRGWALSILNVLPEHVQGSLNHPLFILRQNGMNSNTSITIEGIVVTQNDRFIFHGIDTRQRRPIHGYLPDPERWFDFRNFDLEEPVYGSGLMVGLSAGRLPFAGLFELFAIPDTVVPKDASDDAKEAFRARYKEIVDAVPGVRTLEDTVATLQWLDVRGGSKWLMERIKRIEERTNAQQLLKP